MKSIITNDFEKCFICGSYSNIQMHHIVYGIANRKLSDEDGLIVPLCIYHHTGSNEAVHFNRELDLNLKRIAQQQWMKVYGTKEEFIQRYGRNYLE